MRIRRKKDEVPHNYFCDFCPKGFMRKYDNQKHMKLKHAEEYALKGAADEDANTKILARCKVVDSFNEFYKCDVCDKICSKSYKLISHYSMHTGERKHFCHVCGKVFRLASNLKKHVDFLHLGVKNYACDICDRKFAEKSTRDMHRNIHTDERPFVCSTCGKAFKQRSSLHVHNKFHTNNFPFECNICNKKFRRSNEYKVHSWLHTGYKPWVCDSCGKSFRIQHELKRHQKRRHKLKEQEANPSVAIFLKEEPTED